MPQTDKINDYYNVNAKELGRRYLAQSPEKLHGTLIAILDDHRFTHDILEIGGGIGRDALFFGARYDKDVFVTEPAAALQSEMLAHLFGSGYACAGQAEKYFHDGIHLRRSASNMFVFDYSLNDLNVMLADIDIPAERQFSFINVNAVWQHIEMPQRTPSAATLTRLLAPNGIISVKGRNLPSPEQEGIAWPTTTDELREEFSGLKELLIEEQPDHSTPGSTLTFISAVFQKPVLH